MTRRKTDDAASALASHPSVTSPASHSSRLHHYSFNTFTRYSLLKSFIVICLAESFPSRLWSNTRGRTHAHTRNDVTAGICSARRAIPRMDGGNSKAHKSDCVVSIWICHMRSLVLSLMSPASTPASSFPKGSPQLRLKTRKVESQKDKYTFFFVSKILKGS